VGCILPQFHLLTRPQQRLRLHNETCVVLEGSAALQHQVTYHDCNRIYDIESFGRARTRSTMRLGGRGNTVSCGKRTDWLRRVVSRVSREFARQQVRVCWLTSANRSQRLAKWNRKA